MFDRSVHDNSAATSFAHAPSMHARAQCTEISIPKRDGHTYIPTQNKMRSRISCLALRRSAINNACHAFNSREENLWPVSAQFLSLH